MKRKVGILGGTFDPPHITHLVIANEARAQLGLEKVIFLPNAIPPHKKGSGFVSNQDRLVMTNLATSSNPFFEVDSREIERSGKSYTYETMLEMTQESPDTDFYFIIGADMVEYLPKWYHINELISLIKFVGVNRPDYVRESTYPVEWVNVPEMEISSTLIRQRIALGSPIDYFVPETVKKYIKEHHCYEPNRNAE